MPIAIVLAALVVSISIVAAALIVSVTVVAALKGHSDPACRMPVAGAVGLTRPERFGVSDDEGVSTTTVSVLRTAFGDSHV